MFKIKTETEVKNIYFKSRLNKENTFNLKGNLGFALNIHSHKLKTPVS